MTIIKKKQMKVPGSRIKAFTLVELSIAIVIISFLMAAILKGQNLIAEAKLQAIVAEVSNYQVAVNSFYAKYGQYPGDLAMATGTTGEWGGGTSYGDNNGHIEFKNGSGVYEGYRLWEHLSFANMVNSPYVSVNPPTGIAVPGVNVPLSKSGGGYLFDYSSSASPYDGNTAGAYGMLTKNVMLLGKPLATTASPIQINGILTPNQAMGIDTKMDDGAPTTGNVMGADGKGSTQGNCVDTANSIYKVALSGMDCIMVFQTGNQ